ncbi:hypothetical protein JKY72_00430 [Candidatus Gracilibacteria bacterium]|nr:hypothetical protein [Candidatus Gracilibacteria bacterium]
MGFSVYGNSGLRLMDKEAGAAIKERFLSAVEVTALQSGCAEKVKAISNSLELWAISAEACGDFEGKMKSACEDFVTEEILACGGKGE